jgi:hypothetical protein
MADTVREEPMPRGSVLREVYRLDSTRGKAALLSAILFLVTPSLAFYGSNFFLLLFVPALLLSLVGLSGNVGGSGGGRTRRLAATGYLMVLNGTLVIVALFLFGFINDFLLNNEDEATRTQTIGIGFTTVHIMLGLGLLLVDHYRHAREQA